MLICGTRSFSHADADGSWASSPRPKRSKLKKSLSSALDRAKNTNPYSANGLDKFEKLLAELEARKKQVLLQTKGSSEDTVRFRYINTEDWIPIVIKRPPPPPPLPSPKKEKKASVAAAAAAAEAEKLEVVEEGEIHEIAEVVKDRKVVMTKKRRMSWDWSVQSWAVVIVVVLMCLVFGRAFAVCWATIFWYMEPMMKSSDNLKKKKKKKKKYGERLGSNLSGSTSMKVKKVGDGRSAGSGIT